MSSVNPGVDTNAIHDNEAGEINAVAAKGTALVDADEVLAEDSESGWAKIKITLSVLWTYIASKITDINVAIQTIGSPTYTTQRDFNNLLWSAGLLTDGNVISDAGGATVNIATKSALFRIADDETSALKSANIPALNGQSITADSIRFIVAEYNGGTPQYSIETTNTSNGNTIFAIGSVVNEGGALHILNNAMKSFDGINAIRHRLSEAESPERANALGGLIIGETGTRNVTVSAGEIYNCANENIIDAIDTSGAGTFASYYNAIQQAAAATQWDNQNYNNSGSLDEMTVGRHANLWWYVEMDGNLVMMYGTGQYTSVSLAQAEAPPTTLPNRIGAPYHALLLGRGIFQKGDSTFSVIESVFSTTFQGVGAANHNDMAGLQGGTAGEYYHATGAEYTVIGNTSGTNTGDEPAASTTVAGVQENGTAAEINSDTALRTVTCDALANSKYAEATKGGVNVIVGDGTNVIVADTKVRFRIPYTGTIAGNEILADVSGSIVLDLWKDTYANAPPTVADTITASAKPTLSAAIKSQDNTLSGWTTAVTEGDWFILNVDSASTVTNVTLALQITKG